VLVFFSLEDSEMATRIVILALGVAAVSFVLAAGGAQATTITNPSFEADGDFTGYGWDDARAITGWTKGGIEIWAGTYLAAAISPTAQSMVFDNGKSLDGSLLGHVGEVQVFGNVYKSTLSTTVSGLVVGQQYQLSYYENARLGTAPFDCSVTMGGATIVGSHTVTAVDGSGLYNNLFTRVTSAPFTATATSEALTFINQKPSSDGATDAVWFFDNIQVNAVPEPSTFVLASMGLVALLAYARRRRS
jgi:hypothetical protein